MGLTQRLGTIPLAIQTDSSNNVGIGGAANASYKLDVIGNGKFTSSNFPIDIYGTTNNYGLRINSVQAPTLLLYSSNANSSNRNWGIFTNSEVYGDFDIRQSNAKDGDMTVGANSTSRLYIRNNGNVGIGTSSPARLLDARGTVNLSTTTPTVGTTSGAYADVHLRTFSGYPSAQAKIVVVDYFFDCYSTYTDGFRWFNYDSAGTTPVERMRITGGGQLLVNTTSSLYPNVKFCVKQTLGERTADIWSNWAGDQSTTALSIIKFDNVSSSSQVFQRFVIDNGNVACGQINGNGANQAAFGSWSDARLKENVENLPSQLDNIMALRPVEFDYKDGSGHQIGFIAQEMQEVYADAVGEDSEGFLTITGWSKTEARLVKALQEAVNKIEELNAKVTALENK